MLVLGTISEPFYLKKHSYYFYQINILAMFLLVLWYSLKVNNLVIKVKPYLLSIDYFEPSRKTWVFLAVIFPEMEGSPSPLTTPTKYSSITYFSILLD